jgi:hypothetical protein
VAVFKLEESVVASLLRKYKFIGISDTDATSTAVDGLYLIYGYPYQLFTLDMQQRKIRFVPLQFAASLYGGQFQEVKNYDRSTHIILEHRKTLQDEKGASFSPPAMEGMSGGGIWRITPFNRKKKWTPEEVRLVGIQNKYIAGRYCKGTWIQKAISVIWRQFPELRPAIEWHARGLV